MLYIKVKDFLTEENWCKGALARDCEGCAVGWDNSRAVKWCLVGAISKCYGMHRLKILDDLKRLIIQKYPSL